MNDDPWAEGSQAVVDCHLHLWDIDNHRYDWLQCDPILNTFLGDYTPLRRNYLLGDYLADALREGVGKSVHVQCEFDPTNPPGETEWLQGLADEHGFPHGIVGFADLSSPNAQEVLEAHSRFANFRGIRQNLNFEAGRPDRSFAERGDLISDAAWRRGFAVLAAMGISFDLQLLPHQLLDGAALASDFPETAIALNHVGLPLDRDAEAWAIWREGMSRLASCENVSVKLSGFGMLPGGCSVDAIRPLVLETIEMFGSGRCMFASNFPVDGLNGSYSDFFAAFRLVTSDFSESERASLFGGTAAGFYRI